jgi:hypothetical protein
MKSSKAPHRPKKPEDHAVLTRKAVRSLVYGLAIDSGKKNVRDQIFSPKLQAVISTAAQRHMQKIRDQARIHVVAQQARALLTSARHLPTLSELKGKPAKEWTVSICKTSPAKAMVDQFRRNLKAVVKSICDHNPTARAKSIEFAVLENVDGFLVGRRSVKRMNKQVSHDEVMELMSFPKFHVSRTVYMDVDATFSEKPETPPSDLVIRYIFENLFDLPEPEVDQLCDMLRSKIDPIGFLAGGERA